MLLTAVAFSDCGEPKRGIHRERTRSDGISQWGASQPGLLGNWNTTGVFVVEKCEQMRESIDMTTWEEKDEF